MLMAPSDPLPDHPCPDPKLLQTPLERYGGGEEVLSLHSTLSLSLQLPECPKSSDRSGTLCPPDKCHDPGTLPLPRRDRRWPDQSRPPGHRPSTPTHSPALTRLAWRSPQPARSSCQVQTRSLQQRSLPCRPAGTNAPQPQGEPSGASASWSPLRAPACTSLPAAPRDLGVLFLTPERPRSGAAGSSRGSESRASPPIPGPSRPVEGSSCCGVLSGPAVGSARVSSSPWLAVAAGWLVAGEGELWGARGRGGASWQGRDGAGGRFG